MNQAGFRERLKQMRFEEAYDGYQCSRLTQSEAAALLCVCDRTLRRYINRYHDEGLDGLLDKRMPSGAPPQSPGG